MSNLPTVQQNINEIAEKLTPRFEKHRGGEYFAHLNGSDITIYRKNSTRWDWRVDGRAHEWGTSKSLKEAKVHAWIAGLNTLEVEALRRGQLPIP